MKSKKPVAASPASAERLNVWCSIKCHMPSHYSLFENAAGFTGPIQQTIFRQQRMSYKCFSFFSLFLLGGKLVQREEAAFVESLYSFTICSSCDLWQGPPTLFFGCWPIYISILFLFPVDLYMRIHNSPCCCSFYLGDIHLYFYITFVILFYFWLPRPLDCERGSADITVVLYKRWKSALNMTCVAFLSSRDDVTFHPFFVDSLFFILCT
jgi:hypothetical protein